MTGFVLDCSVAVAWCFEDECTDPLRALLRRAATDVVAVPALWHLEIANALYQAERRKRLDSDGVNVRLGLLQQIGMETDPEHTAATAGSLVGLARQWGLTVYDAVYLELASRRGLALATLDGLLIKAARSTGVPVLPEEPQ